MRFLSILFIFCLLFSNIANAAMLCCVDVDGASESSFTQDAEPSCHGPSAEEGTQDTSLAADPTSNCGCDDCVQFSHAMEQFAAIQLSASPTSYFYYDNYLSLDPSRIYTPPRSFA